MSAGLGGQLQVALGTAYTIERELGGGGMSRVFVARDQSLDRDVVIKVLSPELAATLSAERFTREIKLAAALQEPHIVPLLAAGATADGLPWYTMPFVSGESVRARILRGPLGAAEAVRILRNVAQALAYAHERGVVHRDIKPENVLLSSGTAVVADFGIAKALSASTTQAPGGTLTSIGTSIGTPAYMAPEQAVGDVATDHRADLYAWGVMAYELLSGAHPFARHTTPAALVAAHLTEIPAPLKITDGAPPLLAALVMRCLEKDPAKRPSAASEILAALDQVSVSGRTRSPVGVDTRPMRSRPLVVGVVAAVVLVVAFSAWRVNARAASPASGDAVKSLAVLPFESVGGDTANAYFAEGIADGLTTALAQLPGIRVAGRSSALRFKGKGASAKEVGSALSVSSVLDGTVRRAGGRVRVTAQLTGASDGLVVWTESYDREAKDVFALQDDITRAIVSALQVRLAANAKPTPVAGTANADAYDLYLRGLYLYRRRGPGLLHAAELLEQAIAKDSMFARAHAALATVLLSESYYLPIRMGDVLPRARAAAERAVALDPTLSDGHQALSIAHFHAFEWEPSEREARTAVTLDPSSAEAHYRLGFVLLSVGRVDEAIPEFEKAKASDPLYSIAGAYLGYSYALAGRVDAGVAEGRRAVDLDSMLAVNLSLLGRTYRQAGRSADALAIARRVVALTGEPRLVGLAANAIGRFGDRGEIRALIAKLESLPANTPRRNTGLAFAYLGSGDTTRALDAMERAMAGDGELLFSIVPNDFTFDPVRSSARFAAMLSRIHLDPARFTKANGGPSK
jgi:serine/threonine-protein kinase